MDIGTTLRNARERRNLSLADIASTTKIPIAHLEAIEANAFEQAPPGIFIRGFLRAYAQAVGVDAGQIISQFILERAADAPASLESTLPGPVAADQPAVARPIDPDVTSSGSVWSSVAVIILLVIAVVSIQRFGEPDTVPMTGHETRDQPIASGTAGGTPTQAGTPVATTGQTVPVATTQDVDQPAGRVQLRAEGPCWVEAVVDGRKVVYRLMQPGERTSMDPERELVLRVGDPAALTYFVDGAPGEPLGARGIPVTVRFTSEGSRLTRAS